MMSSKLHEPSKNHSEKSKNRVSKKEHEAADRSSATAKHNPNRFILPSLSSVLSNRVDEVDPPSLEIHGGWMFPDEHYEKIPSSTENSEISDAEQNTASERTLPRGFAMHQTMSMRPKMCSNLWRSNCCCCCCCTCCCCRFSNRYQMIGRNQSPRTYDKSRANLQGTDKGRRKSSTPKRAQMSPFEKDEEVEMTDRKDVGLATICLNKADDGLNRAVKETNKPKVKAGKSSKRSRRRRPSKRSKKKKK